MLHQVRHMQNISIHALLAESDHPVTVPVCVIENFYPRSPCGERLNCKTAETAKTSFLSTLSLRRATSSKIISSSVIAYFYPRSPCGERLDDGTRGFKIDLISIHALLAESDVIAPMELAALAIFLSTLSLRRATARRVLGFVDPDISIHALLAESDYMCPIISTTILIISIHALLAESD